MNIILLVKVVIVLVLFVQDLGDIMSMCSFHMAAIHVMVTDSAS